MKISEKIPHSLLTQQISTALTLERRIVGIRFLPYKAEFDLIERANDQFRSFCWFVNQASLGKGFKAAEKDLACIGGIHSLGLAKPDEATGSGRKSRASGMYSDLAVAKQVGKSMCNLEHTVYGVEIAPLEEMVEADVAIILCLPRQAMRIIQGYAYYFGMPQHLYTVGNKAVCSDLVAKPMTYNDLNISFMCTNARSHTRWDDSLMGVAMPFQKYMMVADGILQTLNPAETRPKKAVLLDKLFHPSQLGVTIEPGTEYNVRSKQYAKYCRQMEQASKSQSECESND